MTHHHNRLYIATLEQDRRTKATRRRRPPLEDEADERPKGLRPALRTLTRPRRASAVIADTKLGTKA